jgi:hypothetical protein
VALTGPSGVSAPKFIQSVGGTTAVQPGRARNRGSGAHTRGRRLHHRGEPQGERVPQSRLSFGHGSSYGFLTWAFVAIGGASLLALLALLPSAVVRARGVVPPKRKAAPQQLDDIAALHDSGAPSDEEYEAAKRQLDGL